MVSSRSTVSFCRTFALTFVRRVSSGGRCGSGSGCVCGSGSGSSSSSSSFVSFVHSGRGSTALWRIVRAGIVPGAVRAALWLPRHTTCIICGVVLQLVRSL